MHILDGQESMPRNPAHSAFKWSIKICFKANVKAEIPDSPFLQQLG
jgi:hypothetical protein